MPEDHRTFLWSMRKAARMLSVICAGLMISGAVLAQSNNPATTNDSTESMFSFSGYGTVGLAHSSENKADFIANDLQLRGAGRNAKWSAEVDSRIGAQLTAKFTPQFMGVIQVTSEQRYDGHYTPDVEWANLKYQVTPDFSVRAGRIVLPTFLLSDSRKVGYASPWVRPPVEVYSLIPLTRLDGIDVSWRHGFGEVSNAVQLSYGQSSARIPNDVANYGGKVTGKNGWAISDTLEYGPSTLHFAYLRTDGTITSYKQLFDGYRSLAAGLPPPYSSQAAAIANQYDPTGKPFSIFTIGASYDPGKWFVMGEYGIIDTHSIYGKRAGWYVTSGYRIGKFTPYVSYAQARLKSNSSDPGLSVPGVFGPVVAYQAGQLNAALNEQLGAAPVQNTVTVGMRWDVIKNVAVKAQFDHTDIGKGSPGSLDHMASDFVPGGKFNVFSVVVDFLF